MRYTNWTKGNVTEMQAFCLATARLGSFMARREGLRRRFDCRRSRLVKFKRHETAVEQAERILRGG